MKTTLFRLVPLFLFTITALAQGPLNPTGAPAPTMKSLQEIYDALEKRVAIPAVPFTITNDGVYYLEGNVMCSGAGVSGITIGSAVKVAVVDLRGFTLMGTVGTAHGINVMSSNATVRIANGQIMGFGGHGVNSVDSSDTIETLTVMSCSGKGAVCGKGSIVQNSVFRFNGMAGCQVAAGSYCFRVRAEDNGGDGLVCDGPETVVSDSSCNGNMGVGLRLDNRGWCFRVRADDNGSDGLRADDDCSVKDIRCRNNLGAGLRLGDRCNAADDDCDNNVGDGMVTGAGCILANVNCRSNLLAGLRLGKESSANDLHCDGNGSDGVVMAEECDSDDANCDSNLGAGIRAGKRCVLKNIVCRNNSSDNANLDDDCSAGNCETSGSMSGWGLAVSNRCTLRNIFSISNSVGALRAGDSCDAGEGRCESSTGPVLKAGSNFVGRVLNLRGTAPAAKAEFGGGVIRITSAVFDVPGIKSTGTVTFTFEQGTITTGELTITNSAEVPPRVTLGEVDLRVTTPSTLDWGQVHITGSIFTYLATNCTSVFFISGQSSIVEETEFRGMSISADANSIIRRCIFGDVCAEYALRTDDNCLVESCTVSKVGDPSGTGGNGIRAGTNSIVRNCTVMNCERNGIDAEERCLVLNNNVCNVGTKPLVTTGTAINVLNGPGLIDGNLCTKGDIGINLTGTNTTVIRNKVSGNTSAIVGIPGNDVGPISSAATAVNPFSNFP